VADVIFTNGHFQETIIIEDDITQPRSTISLSRITTIGSSKEGPFPDMNTYVRRNSKGQYFAALTAFSWQLAEIDPHGNYVRDIGREGSGPGEYRDIDNLIIGPNDSLYVFDQGNGRCSILSPSGEFIYSFRTTWGTKQAAITPSGHLIVQALLSSPERAGLPLHLINRDGAMALSFGDENPMYNRRTATWFNTRVLTESSENTVWTGRLNKYEIELWDTSGNLLKRIENRRDWFREWNTVERYSIQNRPSPSLLAMQEDDSGYLWVIVNVPDSQWSPDLDLSDALFPTSHKALYDSTVEVLDPNSGSLLQSRRIDLPIRYFVGPGLVAHFEETRDDRIVVVISSIQLVNN